VRSDGRASARDEGKLIGLSTAAVYADALGGVGDAIVDEDIESGVCVARHEIGRQRTEGDIAAVGGDGGVKAVVVALTAIAVDTDAFGDVGNAIVHENVGARTVGGTDPKGTIPIGFAPGIGF